MWPRRSRKTVQAAQDALESAEQHLEDVKSREGEVHKLVQDFLRISETNNFAANLREIMIVRHKGRGA
jgi:hypothetical protein